MRKKPYIRMHMVARDLLKLPVNETLLAKDSYGLSTYKIKKSIGDEMDFVKISKGDKHFTVVIKKKKVYNEDISDYVNINTFSIMVCLGILSIHSSNPYQVINNLILTKRGSFAEYVRREIK